jgi:TolB-like protein
VADRRTARKTAAAPQTDKVGFHFSSIAVLPFPINTGPDTKPEQKKYAQEVLAPLAPGVASLLRKGSPFKVFLKERSEPLDGKGEPVAIGKQLGVEAILVGEVVERDRGVGFSERKCIFLKVTLIDVSSGAPAWADDYQLAFTYDLKREEVALEKSLADTIPKIAQAVSKFAVQAQD